VCVWWDEGGGIKSGSSAYFLYTRDSRYGICHAVVYNTFRSYTCLCRRAPQRHYTPPGYSYGGRGSSGFGGSDDDEFDFTSHFTRNSQNSYTRR